MTSEPKDRGWHPADAILHRFVDGDATPGERTTVEALLAGDPEAYTRTSDYQRQNIALQALYPRRVNDTMLPPAALNLAAGLRRRRTVRRAAAACITMVAVLGAGVSGWSLRHAVPGEAPLPVVAVFPQAPATTPTVTEPSRVVATVPVATGAASRDATGWLTEGEARIAVHPPNLQAIGYQLVDGRAALTAYGPVIRFAYEPVEGVTAARLALTVAAFGADRQVLATSINPQHASLFWHSGQLLYALSGNVEPGRLVRVADVVSGVERPAEPTTEPAAETPTEAPALPVTPVSGNATQPKDT